MGRHDIHCVDDLRRRSRKRLPRFVFDFVEGGAGHEITVRRNLAAFESVELVPRLGGSRNVSTSHALFGETFGAPFGVAPLGLAELVAPNADLVIARAAAQANIPYICSAASGVAIEDIARASGRVPWFQLYSPADEHVVEAILERLIDCGCEVLVVTVDAAVPGTRLKDRRNGLSLPLRLTRQLLANCMTAPRWTLSRLAAGQISFPNFERHMHLNRLPFYEMMALQTAGLLDWDRLEALRWRWPRKLVIKGVLSRHDAVRARQVGIDGLIVSNHGGRQLDGAPASLDRVGILRAVSPDGLVMLDSGIRSGLDVAKALVQGVDFTWIGRPFLYALSALGEEGPGYLIDLLVCEFKNALALMGSADCANLRMTQMGEGISRSVE